MPRAYYSDKIKKFLSKDIDDILGQLLINDEHETTDLQRNSWRSEIVILKQQLRNFDDGEIVFEYTIPRIGHRIDVACILNGIIFILEFKVGDEIYQKSTDDQVMDYALDLKYFHEESQNRFIIPISVATEAPNNTKMLEFMEDRIAKTLWCNKDNIGITLRNVLNVVSDDYLSIDKWINSRYFPTPTIIEAAQAMYRSHSVQEISRSDATVHNLTETTNAINRIIDCCKKDKKKAICFVTGVPGAGKTLAGLNIANSRHQFEEEDHAVFLSGNGPLVDVLQEALARDKARRTGCTLTSARTETKAFIQIIHKFRDEAITSDRPPVEKVAIYDEAQRAWDEANLSKFMRMKKGVSDFNQSEPEFLISIMDRHKDWAVIVCLVGGGQEIYTGEAGIEDWFRVLKEKYQDWDVYLSDKMTDSEYIGSSSIEQLLGEKRFSVETSLHLSVSLRSFRSEKLASFVKSVLDNHASEAECIYKELSKTYSIYITRDYQKAKEWVKTKARGTERYGLLASSGGKRLRADGIWVLSEINHVAWFLNDKNNIDSSYYMEVAASEFKVQGLEVDYAVLAWDADFRRVNDNFDYYIFRGTAWNHINAEQKRKYLKNAYRVLLTRARQGLVIYVPEGVAPDEDITRNNKYYDDIYSYLRSCGIKELG